jgi:hypothetical protein
MSIFRFLGDSAFFPRDLNGLTTFRRYLPYLMLTVSSRREVNPLPVPGPTGVSIDGLVVVGQAACKLAIHVDHVDVLIVAPWTVERYLFSIR